LRALDRPSFLGAVIAPDVQVQAGSEQAIERSESGTIAAALARLPLLHGAESGLIRSLAATARPRHVEPGDPLAVEGAVEDCFHVLLEGRVAVTVDGRYRRDLLPGDTFGEIAVLHRVPRTASVTAAEPTTVLVLQGEALRAAVASRGGRIGALVSSGGAGGSP
jgi:CRP-like cAMP-binding protein